jgi:DNA primase
MPKNQFVDFKAVKASITMEQVLQQYGLMDQFKKSGDSLSGPCPIHKGSNPTQFRVSVSKNIWNCFSECKNGGNVLDFIARMENISIHAAAVKAISWFDLDCEITSAKFDRDEQHPVEAAKSDAASAGMPASKKTNEAPENTTPNKPLKFRLDKLQRDHPYLFERGLTLETIEAFGIGFCSKGMMAQRIAIPICDAEGNAVAYAGRWPGEPPEGTPKYKLPQGFRKSLELFNIERAIKEPPEKPLVIVEGFFGAMKLHQLGCRKVVALMGSTMSPAQEEMIRRYTDRNSHIIVVLDEDEAGWFGRQDIAIHLSRWAFVRVHVFSEKDKQPEHLTAEELADVLA